MSMKMMKTHPLMKIMSNTIVDLPSPSNINNLWNMGSILGLCLTSQIMTGIFLAMHYKSDQSIAFSSVIHICYDVNFGWLMRTIHANGTSLFFIAMFTHTGRGLYFGSYRFMETWNIGVIIMLTTMATAFLGYVLPWGQMSFWGATVITNLLSAIPYVGTSIVEWLWGGFAVSDPTLSRFFSLHFLMPFAIVGLSAIHLMFLHETGSNNPLGINSNFDKIPFHPYFSIKDTMGFLVVITTLISLSFISPYELGDPENFLPANPLSTPVHIKPEWYFLFAYAILRSIPNKIGGVIALAMSVLILMSMPMTHKMKLRSSSMYPANKIMFWTMTTSVVLLSWIGARPVEEPFITIGQILSVIYFSYFMISPLSHKMWDNMNKK